MARPKDRYRRARRFIRNTQGWNRMIRRHPTVKMWRRVARAGEHVSFKDLRQLRKQLFGMGSK